MRYSVMRPFAIMACVVMLSCTKAAPHDDDAGSVVPSAAMAVDAAPPVPPMFGEWERATEPYQGMRIAIRGDAPTHAVVTRTPAVTDERIAAQKGPAAIAKAQLECQRSLWRVGEELVSGLHEGDGKILVRDWGLTAGTCRHADSHAPAHLTVTDGALNIDVTRGKTTVAQQWTRVGP